MTADDILFGKCSACGRLTDFSILFVNEGFCSPRCERFQNRKTTERYSGPSPSWKPREREPKEPLPPPIKRTITPMIGDIDDPALNFKTILPSIGRRLWNGLRLQTDDSEDDYLSDRVRQIERRFFWEQTRENFVELPCGLTRSEKDSL